MLRLIANASDPRKLSDQSKKQLEELSQKLGGLSKKTVGRPTRPLADRRGTSATKLGDSIQ